MEKFCRQQKNKILGRSACIYNLVVAVAMLTFFGVGCGRSPQEYARYAEAGGAYSAAMDNLLVASRDLFIDAQSEKLLQDRELAFDEQNFRASNERAQRYIDVTEDLRDHTELMARYFALLQELASSNAPTRAGAAAQGIAGQLSILGNSLRGSPILGEPAVGAIGTLTEIAVSSKIRSNLRREFTARQQTIRRELITQERLLAALSKGIRNDLETSRILQMQRLVEDPLRNGEAAQPSNQDRWIQNRRRVLTSQRTIRELLVASRNVGELRGVYEDLLQGRMNIARVNNLITDLNTLLAATESLRRLSQG